MFESDRFRTKPDPGQNLSGKIFASGNSPEHLESKYTLYKNRTVLAKSGFLCPGKIRDIKNLSF